MNQSITRRLGLTLGAALATAVAAGSAVAADLPGEGRTAIPTVSSIAEEQFQTRIVAEGLRRLGYKVNDALEIEYAAGHIALGNGDAHFNVVHWDPLHTEFFNNSGGEEKLVKFGPVVGNSLQGYLIDKKTADAHGITHLDQLRDPKIAALFDASGDGKADLTGCTPGWGCERVIEHHLKAYDLQGSVNHNQGSYFALMANTISRFNEGKPILYYTWTPLWVSGVLVPGRDVEWLEVPRTDLPPGEEGANTKLPDGRNVGFSVNDQKIVANRAWVEDNPAAARFFELVKIDVNDISAQNHRMNEGEDSDRDIDRHVQEWIEKNSTDFNAWVAEALTAAS